MTDCLPPRHSDADRLADAWRYNLADADYAALFVVQEALSDEEPRLRRHHINTYLAAVRAASECEERMTAAGIPFQRRSIST